MREKQPMDPGGVCHDEADGQVTTPEDQADASLMVMDDTQVSDASPPLMPSQCMMLRTQTQS